MFKKLHPAASTTPVAGWGMTPETPTGEQKHIRRSADAMPATLNGVTLTAMPAWPLVFGATTGTMVTA